MTAPSGEFEKSGRESGSVEQQIGIPMASPHPSRTGSLTIDGDTATIAFERRIRHPVDVVWKALTEPEQLAGWYMTTVRVAARAGGSIDYVSGPSRFHVTGKVLAWDPPRLFEHEWNVEAQKDLPHGERSIVRWELTPDGEGTILRVTHRRLTRGTAHGFVSGLHVFLDRLEQQLDGTPLVDFVARVNELRPSYQPSGK